MMYNPCDSSPCLHGVCNCYGNNFLCACNYGYTGNLCDQVVDYCASNPCMNGGQCTTYVGRYVIILTFFFFLQLKIRIKCLN